MLPKGSVILIWFFFGRPVRKDTKTSHRADADRSTPETTNPVTTTCEAEEVPCISTMAPWQPWFIGRQANPAGGPPAPH